MSLISASLPVSLIPEAQGLARIVFGLLLVRHGLEQVFGYPPALVDYPPFSLRGALKILTLPGGILVMLGLFTRPVCLTISLLYLAVLARRTSAGQPAVGPDVCSARVGLPIRSS